MSETLDIDDFKNMLVGFFNDVAEFYPAYRRVTVSDVNLINHALTVFIQLPPELTAEKFKMALDSVGGYENDGIKYPVNFFIVPEKRDMN